VSIEIATGTIVTSGVAAMLQPMSKRYCDDAAAFAALLLEYSWHRSAVIAPARLRLLIERANGASPRNLIMDKKQNQNECRCQTTSCGCAATPARCTCGDDCACSGTCTCAKGCGCSTAK